jgi:hypothetical protein
MRLTPALSLLLPCLALVISGCPNDPADDGAGETATDTTGDGDGDGDGDQSGDGDGDGDGDAGDGDGDGDAGDGDGDGDGDAGDGDGDGDTGPMCSPEETECDGECANLDEDASHCGACGHDCLGGVCNTGVCEPVELATGKGRLFMVHVDQNHIYYGGDGVDVGRIDKDGSNDTILAPAGMDLQQREWCYTSAFTGTHVVWGNDWVQPGVRGCIVPDCAGGVQTLEPGMNMYTMSFDSMNGKLYWNQGNDIVEAAWPNGMMTTFTTTVAPRDIVSDGDFVYWISRVGADDYHVRKRPVGGGNVTELAINRMDAYSLAVAPTKVLWEDTNAIVEAALPNGIGGADPAVFAPVTGIRQIVVDSSHVYWTSQQDNVGTVGRCPIDGCDGPPEIMAQIPEPWGITFDPVAIYFVTEDGAIYKVAK